MLDVALKMAEPGRWWLDPETMLLMQDREYPAGLDRSRWVAVPKLTQGDCDVQASIAVALGATTREEIEEHCKAHMLARAERWLDQVRRGK